MNRITKAAVLGFASCALAMGGAGAASAADGPSGANAEGVAAGSPGVVSGNVLQVPVHVPVNACGLTVNVVGLLNPAAGNTCKNS